MPRAVSRPTDQATQLGPVAAAAVADAAAVVPPPGALAEPSPQTSLGGDDDVALAPRRGRTPILVLVLALAVAGFVVILATQRGGAKVAVVVPDAAAPRGDVALIVEPGPVDAAVLELDAAMVADAARPPDAAGHTVVHHRRDAGVIAVRPDATPQVVVPVGSGTVTIRATEGSNYFTIDGGAPLVPPANNKKLAAGKHTIKFYDGRTSAVLDTQAIELHDGEHLTVRQH